jgi:hypothetical protein
MEQATRNLITAGNMRLLTSRTGVIPELAGQYAFIGFELHLRMLFERCRWISRRLDLVANFLFC